MNSFIRTTLAALVVATAGVAASAPAQAGGIGFEFSIGGPASGRLVRDHGRSGGWDRFEEHRGGRDRDACKAGKALRKAGDMGLRRAEIVRSGHNRVVVEGFRHRRPVRVAFANERNCPVIGWDR
ncbi:hypothetical protein IMCC20628_00791 [Hoeflea sp. IMCC20628]|uniref:hypothetical protein n=1 Tax=Hoeflea sp. IMCC20628 TaxID=1620421 RepID=UPI00063AF28F|nr:hypothetical protein [Hoeflea sp. IMCC20628]AKH99512.1 hypothetical protein IMCC20628_00791 [Hoeflea sp. IMCC20628]